MGILLPVLFFRSVVCFPPHLELVLCQVKKRLVPPIPILACSYPVPIFHPHLLLVLPIHNAKTILSLMIKSHMIIRRNIFQILHLAIYRVSRYLQPEYQRFFRAIASSTNLYTHNKSIRDSSELQLVQLL